MLTVSARPLAGALSRCHPQQMTGHPALCPQSAALTSCSFVCTGNMLVKGVSWKQFLFRICPLKNLSTSDDRLSNSTFSVSYCDLMLFCLFRHHVMCLLMCKRPHQSAAIAQSRFCPQQMTGCSGQYPAGCFELKIFPKLSTS